MSTSTHEKTKEIYCLKCRARTLSGHLENKVLKNKKDAISGKCTVCGTKTFTIVASKKK